MKAEKGLVSHLDLLFQVAFSIADKGEFYFFTGLGCGWENGSRSWEVSNMDTVL